MIPIGDDNSQRRLIPVVTWMLVAANVLVFLLELAGGDNFVYTWAFTPAYFSQNPTAFFITIFTSMFMHASWLHLGGNMLYLLIFGDNVEDRMGSFNYLLFYLAGGVAASLAHILTNPGSQIPTVGASGAIGAVLGAYLVLFPRSRVLTFIPLGFFMRLTLVPASIVLGLWFVLQLFSGVLSLGGPDVGGVAFWAHIGGFAFGALIAFLFAREHKPSSTTTW